jgi:TolB-like protein/Tfp pilus assembly protein PilF
LIDYGIFAAVTLLVGFIAYGLLAEKEALIPGDKVPVEASVTENAGTGSEVSGSSVLPNSIAVLPFADLSQAGDQEYFADGLADTLLHVLAQVHGLKVAARTSSFAFKGKNEDIKNIARQLGVANVLEGSIQKSGNRIRVIAQLIEAEQGTHLWSHTFDGTLDDIFVIQDDIAEDVVNALQLVLLAADTRRLAERYRPDLQAYDQMVLGRFAAAKGRVDYINAAVEHFQEAIRIDPNYPLPYVYLADTLSLQEIYALGIQDTFSGYTTPRIRKEQQRLINKALKLDPLSGEAYASRATTQLNEAVAETDFLKAIQLNDNYAPAYLWYSRFLSIRQGRYEDALAQLETALQLDPLSTRIRHEHAKMVWATGRAEEAMQLLTRYVKDNPDYPPYYKRMTRWHAQLGDMGRAALWVKALRKLEPDSPSHWGEWGGECWVLARLNDRAAAKNCTQEFVRRFPDSITARRILATAATDPTYDSEVPDTANPTDQVLALFQALVEAEPGNDYRANQYASFLEQVGQSEALLSVMQTAHPQFFAAEPVVSGETTWPATMTINALLQLGRDEEAGKLIEAFSTAIAGMRLIAGPGFTTGIEDVEIASLQGDTERALQLFEQSINQGWRFMWDLTPFMPNLANIRRDPRFNALYLRMQADIDRQREWFYANQEMPLY